MLERRPVDGTALVIMVVLCMLLGMQTVAMKAAEHSMAPTLQIAIRSGVASLVIAAIVLIRGDAAALRDATWRPGLFVGVLFAVEFLLVGEGLRFTNASHMAIFLYTSPIFAALGLHFLVPDERLTPLQWMGTCVAFGGVVCTFAGRGDVSGSESWWGDLLGLAAGAAWGATTLVIRFSRLSNAPATVTLLYQLAAASIILSGAAIFMRQTAVSITPVLVASLGFQSLVISVGAYLTWFALLRVYLASRLGVLMFMTPVFGVFAGVLLLGERLDGPFFVGAPLVILGFLLVSSRDLVGARMRSVPAAPDRGSCE